MFVYKAIETSQIQPRVNKIYFYIDLPTTYYVKRYKIQATKDLSARVDLPKSIKRMGLFF